MKTLGRMKGASMKIGQLLSADPDMLPPGFAEQLTSLQSAAPPMTYSTVKLQIETALEQRIEDVFHTFDPAPVGSASIGQVHRGRLHSGEEVAVKVQYPGIIDSLDSDMRNMGALMNLGRAVVDKRRLDEYLAEVKKAMREESDYTLEAANLRRAVEQYAGLERVRVPEPFEEWTRPPVLVMEYIEGEKLDEALIDMEPGPRRNEIMERVIRTYVWMFHHLMEMHSDPHPGNFLLDDDDNLVILDFGCVKAYSDATFPDGILRMLIACWNDDDEGAAALYRELGFGGEDADPSVFDPGMIREYHEIILKPFIYDEPFNLGNWAVREELRKWVWKNPKFLKLVPPADLVLYMRVLSGLKGLMFKLNATLHLYPMAREAAIKRGLIAQ